MVTPKFTLLHVAIATRMYENKKATFIEKNNAELAVRYILAMDELKLPSGGVFGGKYAFRYTSSGAGSLNSRELREAWFAANGWELESFCDTCNKVQRNAIGHLYPRALGGSWDKVHGAEHSVPECAVCNSNKGEEVMIKDQNELYKIEIPVIEGWM